MTYLVEVYCYHPYKISESFRIEASSFPVAIRRGIEGYRKTKISGKKVKEMFVKATFLSALK